MYQSDLLSLAVQIRAGDFREARAAAVSLVDRYPQSEIGWKVLGVCAKELGDFEQSLMALGRAYSLNPRDAEVQNALGATYLAFGNPIEAERCFRKAIGLKAGYVEALYNLAVTLSELSQLDAARAAYRKALGFDPHHVESWNNLGLLQKQVGQWVDAEACFRQAIRLRRDHAAANRNLAILLEQLGRFEEAEAAYRVACALDPNSVELQRSLAGILQGFGKLDKAVDIYERVLVSEPTDVESHVNRGLCLHLLGEHDRALRSYEAALRLAPERHSHLDHLINALSGRASNKAPEGYVASLFDGYAESFEENLVAQLRYETPKIISSKLRAFLGLSPVPIDVLDLGCGTGLSGVAVADLARSMVGVDLSEKMLEKAGEKQCYSRLVQGDIESVLDSEQPCSFDLVLSSDVFVYVGDLSRVFIAAFNVLRVGGFFAFSVEAMFATENTVTNQGDFTLCPSGRFAHSESYIRVLAEKTGFRILDLSIQDLRREKNEPVRGYVVLLQR